MNKYCPLSDYGIIGNMRSAALVSVRGSIDWLCLPRFDSPSVFGALLDSEKGGRFRVAPVGDDVRASQIYWPDTNILITRFHTAVGVAEVIDFMPLVVDEDEPCRPVLVRLARCLSGEVRLRADVAPAFDYARASHKAVRRDGAVVFESGGARLMVSSSAGLEVSGGGAGASMTLRTGESHAFFLHHLDGSGAPAPCRDQRVAERLLEQTRVWWRRWVSRCTYEGRWSEMVRRSALALKLLTYEPTGAIVAAPTCSLPAPVGGVRNWDYRYTWIRDAAFTVYGFLRVGFTEEACAFMRWLEARCHEIEPDGMLQPLYGIEGAHRIDEFTLDHLDGYMGSRPVRVGNAAYEQVQLDVPGALMDAAYLYNKHAEPVSYELWRELTRILDWTCGNWRRTDHGVWEVRGPEREFVYSRLMCWVALDRGVRLADKRSFPGPVERWRKQRDEIYTQIMEKGWSKSAGGGAGAGAFVQRYGSDALDAANLIMPLVFFVSPQDPRMLSTLDAVLRPPAEGGLTEDVQVFRYRMEDTDDGLPGEEGGFNICAFWLVEALTRAGRHDPARLEQARLMMEKLIACSNHLGLYAEQTGDRGEPVGNFPQAFTHLSFISAAFNLNRVLGGG